MSIQSPRDSAPLLSVAGQISEALEAALPASRADLYSPWPAQTTCFFNDPLGRVLEAHAPRCDSTYEWLWPALRTGSITTLNGQHADLGSLLGNLSDADLVNQWMFFHFLHWYAHPLERFHAYMQIAFPERRAGGRRQTAPAAYIWNGYRTVVRTLAQRYSDCPSTPPPIVSEGHRRFTNAPRWVDALARLGDRGLSDYKTASALLGRSEIATSTPDWRWEAEPSPNPITVQLGPNRVSPLIFSRLCEALAWDHWLVHTHCFNLREHSARPPQKDLQGERSMNDALIERERGLQELRSGLETETDSTNKSKNMRLATSPMPASQCALERLPLQLRLVEEHLDPAEPDLLELSGHDGFLTDLLKDPLRVWFVHVDVHLEGATYETYALTYGYESERGPIYNTGYLRMEVQRCAGIPYLDDSIGAGRVVRVRKDAASVGVGRVRRTGELLFLLRLVLDFASP